MDITDQTKSAEDGWSLNIYFCFSHMFLFILGFLSYQFFQRNDLKKVSNNKQSNEKEKESPPSEINRKSSELEFCTHVLEWLYKQHGSSVKVLVDCWKANIVKELRKSKEVICQSIDFEGNASCPFKLLSANHVSSTDNKVITRIQIYSNDLRLISKSTKKKYHIPYVELEGTCELAVSNDALSICFNLKGGVQCFTLKIKDLSSEKDYIALGVLRDSFVEAVSKTTSLTIKEEKKEVVEIIQTKVSKNSTSTSQHSTSKEINLGKPASVNREDSFHSLEEDINHSENVVTKENLVESEENLSESVSVNHTEDAPIPSIIFDELQESDIEENIEEQNNLVFENAPEDNFTDIPYVVNKPNETSTEYKDENSNHSYSIEKVADTAEKIKSRDESISIQEEIKTKESLDEHVRQRADFSVGSFDSENSFAENKANITETVNISVEEVEANANTSLPSTPKKVYDNNGGLKLVKHLDLSVDDSKPHDKSSFSLKPLAKSIWRHSFHNIPNKDGSKGGRSRTSSETKVLRQTSSQVSLNAMLGQKENKNSSLLIESPMDNGRIIYYHIPPMLSSKSHGIQGQKIHVYNNHLFVATHFSDKLPKCGVCKSSLKGIGKQGYLCRDCGLVAHKNCHCLVESMCEKSSLPMLQINYVGATDV